MLPARGGGSVVGKNDDSPPVSFYILCCVAGITRNNKSIRKECVIENYLYFSTKTCVVSTQKNRLNETVLLSTQNICLHLCVRK